MSSLYVFWEASQASYRFVVYNVSLFNSSFIFTKTKMAPIESRSIPTLELVPGYSALRCLETILDAFASVAFERVVIAVDAQIVLSWILSGDSKTKRLFVRNRIKDINKWCLEYQSRITISFKYACSSDNPADMQP